MTARLLSRAGPSAGLALALLAATPEGAAAQFYWPWETPPRPAPQIIIQRPPPRQSYGGVPYGAAPAAPSAPRHGVIRHGGAPKRGEARATPRPSEAKPPPPKPQEEAAQPAPEAPPPPYEPQMLRLSELMGALAFLHPLCGGETETEWRSRMTALIDAEAPAPQRRERLAGAYNRGFREYSVTYRRCTPAAETIISRYLAEGGRLTRELSSRFGG
ncbi:TIGR02301 family protein [Alsobacter sp. SYSU BS001988]